MCKIPLGNEHLTFGVEDISIGSNSGRHPTLRSFGRHLAGFDCFLVGSHLVATRLDRHELALDLNQHVVHGSIQFSQRTLAVGHCLPGQCVDPPSRK